MPASLGTSSRTAASAQRLQQRFGAEFAGPGQVTGDYRRPVGGEQRVEQSQRPGIAGPVVGVAGLPSGQPGHASSARIWWRGVEPSRAFTS